MQVINLELTADSIDAAITELKAYRDHVESATQRIVKRLAEDGAELARELVPVDTGNLMGSINAEIDGETGYIRTDCNYAAFVEFGTGVIGVANPYPGTAMGEAGYVYMGGEHHVTLKDGRDGWFYPLDDGSWRFTQGQPTRPFMYNTAQMMAQAVPDVVTEELQS